MATNTIEPEKKRFEQFLETHKKKSIPYKAGCIEYYSSGKGKHTVVVLPHISNLFAQEMSYNHILHFEKYNKVLAPELIGAATMEEVAGMLHHLLEKENCNNVIIYGQSGSGITAQIFFKRYYRDVKGMILVNTIGPGKKANKKKGLAGMLRFIPGFFLKGMLKKTMTTYAKNITIPEKSLPRIRQSRALMETYFTTRFSKKNLVNEMEIVFRFNEEKIPTEKELPGWNGRVLIVTSEDDSGYEDSIKLSEALPHSELFVFEKGFGHLTPAIRSDEFYRKVNDFIAGLE